MRILRSVVIALTVAAFAVPVADAEEPYVEFLQGLRDRSYYDYALLYLDTLQEDASVPKDIRDVIPYEKAATLLLMARSGAITNPEVQSRQLYQALGSLKSSSITVPTILVPEKPIPSGQVFFSAKAVSKSGSRGRHPTKRIVANFRSVLAAS